MAKKEHPLVKATRQYLAAKRRLAHWNPSGRVSLTTLRASVHTAYEEYKRQAALVGIDVTRWV